jgi:hypothetical protein
MYVGEVTSQFKSFRRRFVQEPVPSVPMPVPSTTRRALFNGMLKFSVAQTMIFTFFIAPSMIPQIIVRTMENLSKALDRVHRVVLVTRMECLEQVPGRIAVEILKSAGNFSYVYYVQVFFICVFVQEYFSE